MMNSKIETPGHIVRTLKDGLPILWTYVPEMPDVDTRTAMPWLTVVGWKYDGAAGQGMPGSQENQHMLKLEAALANVELGGFCMEVYRRIGAGLREFVLYIHDRDQFMHEFNRCVAGHPRYPIAINFYRDEAWSELQDLIDDFEAAAPANQGSASPAIA